MYAERQRAQRRETGGDANGGKFVKGTDAPQNEHRLRTPTTTTTIRIHQQQEQHPTTTTTNNTSSRGQASS
jgi:hypothetical protein